MPVPGHGPVNQLGIHRPTTETGRHLRDVGLTERIQTIEKGIALAVVFIERPGRHANAVGQGPPDLRQGHRGLGPMDHVFGNPSFFALDRIVGPTLRQEQIAVQQTVKLACAVAQMHAHYAIVHLAGPATPLMLHGGGMVALLGTARLVHRPDGPRMAVIAHHDLLDPVHHPRLVPTQKVQKGLQRSRRNPCLQGHRLDTLSLQARVLATHVHPQIRRGVTAPETVGELRQELPDPASNPLDLRRIHAFAPFRPRNPRACQE